MFLFLCVLAPFFCSKFSVNFFSFFSLFFYKLICFQFHLVDAFCVLLPVAVRQGDRAGASPQESSSSTGRGWRDARPTLGLSPQRAKGSTAVRAEQPCRSWGEALTCSKNSHLRLGRTPHNLEILSIYPFSSGGFMSSLIRREKAGISAACYCWPWASLK